MSKNDRAIVVVTGLGATTPLGGDVASTWSAMLAGTSGVQRHHRILGGLAAGEDRRARRRRTRSRWSAGCRRAGWTAASSSRSSRPARPGPTRARRTVDPWRLGVAVTSGIGGIGSTLAGYDTLREQRLGPHLAVHRPDADAERRGRLDQHRVRGQGRGARAGERVRVRCRGHRVRHRHDPLRPRRCRRGRRDRGRDHGPEHRRVRRDARHVHPQRRADAGVPAVRQGPRRVRARRGRRRAGPGVAAARPGARRADLRRGGGRRVLRRRLPHLARVAGRRRGRPSPCPLPSRTLPCPLRR